MHSCPKKTSEAMFDWMATTALKTLIRKNYYTYKEHLSRCSFLDFLLNWCNWHSCCEFSRLQIWLQFDEVNYLKFLVDMIYDCRLNIFWFFDTFVWGQLNFWNRIWWILIDEAYLAFSFIKTYCLCNSWNRCLRDSYILSGFLINVGYKLIILSMASVSIRILVVIKYLQLSLRSAIIKEIT